MKIFSTMVHGVLDYLTAGMLLALPRMLGWDKRVTQMMTGAAVATVGYSALTSYELGLVKVLPMRAHLALDALNGALFCAGPLLFPDEDTSVRGALLGIGVFELAAALMTEPEPAHKRIVVDV